MKYLYFNQIGMLVIIKHHETYNAFSFCVEFRTASVVLDIIVIYNEKMAKFRFELDDQQLF